jgi:hypothetical protein
MIAFEVAPVKDMIGDLEESILDGSGFYMNRNAWAKYRVEKEQAGNYILPFAGAANIR